MAANRNVLIVGNVNGHHSGNVYSEGGYVQLSWQAHTDGDKAISL